ncbi:MAG: hypothetical protein AVDCRST_MAG03-3090 [uncultured Rubrobacteraceae bacterium]|uniref:Phytanoyl-CoA dioxygenase n=1 Tax=uncultured Rubrobacteraceae bacterium TaxID=349277 RepID=A0A6J4PY02_9ACTN|nr:MAG: hypothetical protein AVDCRST_MAG03-3090 [uncultured Rubrobacteraceae bacterium]
MSVLRVVSGATEDEARRGSVYSGDLLVFEKVPPMAELCAYADALIRAAFETDNPVRAQFELDRDEYLSRVETLQKRFRKDDTAKELFLAALGHVGVDLRRTSWDWLYLRVSPHGDEYAGRRTAKLGFHRDTWSSNVYAQTNWWAPIYPITAGRTVAFYPAYWDEPIENTSRGWDLEEIRAGTSSAPVVPEPAETVDTASELRPVIEPGDLLCFSGAHLHASVPNTTGVARFSVEVRTVDAGDAADGRGAPNVDGEAPRVASGWFRHVEDGATLPEISHVRPGSAV